MPPIEVTGSAATGQAVRYVTGASTYTFVVRHPGSAEARLLDDDGVLVAELQITTDDGGRSVVGSLRMATGEEARIVGRRFASPAAELNSHLHLTAEGQALELSVGIAEDHSAPRATLAAAGAFSELREGYDRPGELPHVLPLIEADGTPVDPARIAAWLDTVELDALDTSPAAAALLVTFQDLSLVTAMIEATGAAMLGGMAIHATYECMDVTAAVASLAADVPSCGICIAALTASELPIVIPQVVAIISCVICVGITGVLIWNWIRCRNSSSEAPPDCPAYECPEPGELATLVTGSTPEAGHECECRCDELACSRSCQESPPMGRVLCATACELDDCQCHWLQCGNGRIDTEGDECNEECDPNARPPGCREGFACNVDTCVCEPVTCGPCMEEMFGACPYTMGCIAGESSGPPDFTAVTCYGSGTRVVTSALGSTTTVYAPDGSLCHTSTFTIGGGVLTQTFTNPAGLVLRGTTRWPPSPSSRYYVECPPGVTPVEIPTGSAECLALYDPSATCASGACSL